MMRQLSRHTEVELQQMLRWWRQVTRYQGRAEFPSSPVGAYFTRLFRTQGDNPGNLADSTYPTQTDGDGARLPGVFLSVVYDAGASDPVTVQNVDEDERQYVYSFGGWIPRLTILRVSYRGGVWVPDWVPEIPVRFDAAVTAPDDVTVEQISSGDANGQTFTAHLDFMAGTAASAIDEEALAWLNEKTKRWEVINKECSA